MRGHKLKRPQVWGEAGVKKKRAHADIGGGGVKQEWTPTYGSKFKYVIP